MNPAHRMAHFKAGGAALVLALFVATSGQAQEALVPASTLSPELALEIAQTSLNACRAEGYQVAVAVVDRMGVPQVMLRDRCAVSGVCGPA